MTEYKPYRSRGAHFISAMNARNETFELVNKFPDYMQRSVQEQIRRLRFEQQWPWHEIAGVIRITLATADPRHSS